MVNQVCQLIHDLVRDEANANALVDAVALAEKAHMSHPNVSMAELRNRVIREAGRQFHCVSW